MTEPKYPFFRMLLVFLFGVFSTSTFNIGLGTLRIGEVMGLGGIVLVLFSGKVYPKLKMPFVNRAIYILIFWMVFQVLADLHNKTESVQTIKGLANLGFTITTFLFLVIYVDRSVNVLFSLLIGRAIGAYFLFDYLETSEEILSNEYWDIRVSVWAGPLAIMAGMLLARYSRFAVFIGVFVYGAASIAFGGRAHGFIFCFTSLAVLLLPRIKRRLANMQRRTLIRIVLVSVAMISVVYPVFVYLGSSGVITKKTQEQLLSVDNPYNPLELVMAGRAGIEFGATAIKKRPIAGYGSRAYTGDYLPLDYALARPDYNYIHSRFFESWTFGGIACGFCCIALWILTLWQCVATLSWSQSEATLVATYVGVAQTWGFLFSPLASLRLAWPIAAIMILCIDQHFRHRDQKSNLGVRYRPTQSGVINTAGMGPNYRNA